MKNLFIGSKGTLGIITECSLLCHPKIVNRNVALIAFQTTDDLLTFMQEAKRRLSDILFGFELLDNYSMQLVNERSSKSNYPFSSMHPYYALIETGSGWKPS